jgi:hypothetical protein
MTIADNVRNLPSVENIAKPEMLDQSGIVVATFENKPGKAGSWAICYDLAAPPRDQPGSDGRPEAVCRAYR